MRNTRVFCTHLLGLCLILYDARSEGCGGYGKLALWIFLLKHLSCSFFKSCMCNVGSGSPPPPPNISHSSDKQSLELSWLRIQGTSERDVYEIQISRTENHLIIDKVSNWYNLMWFSDLPLECVDHSVRMRLFCNQTFHSPWSTWITHHATDKSQIFPSGKILKEGSNATFCCIPRVNANIAKISFERKSFDLLNNTYGVKAILVTNLTIPDRLFKFLVLVCSESTGNTVDTFNYISFPPQKPRNLSCTTSDMKSINCTWDLDRKRDKYDRNKQNITLHIESTDHPPISCQPQSCVFQADQQQQEYKIRVEIKDKLGEENATYSFNIAERVSPALTWEKVIAGVTNVSLSLNVSVLKNMTCQVWLDTENTKEVISILFNFCVDFNFTGLCNVLLDGLHFNTSYSARVRCSVNGIFWGEWTPTTKFTTNPLVTLDLWRKIQSNRSSDTLLKITKRKKIPLLNIYKIKWSRGGQPQTEEKDGGESQADILIGPELSNITVQAVPKFGSSIPAHITIPPKDESEIPQLKKHLNNISAAGLHLWWEKQISVTCGYTVVWCRRTAASNLDWIKVPKENNTLFIPTGNFKRGHRYSFNIYGCSENGDKLLEIQTGYMQGNGEFLLKEGVFKVLFHSNYIYVFKSVTIDGLQPHQDYVCCACEVTKVGRGLPDTWMTETNSEPYSIHSNILYFCAYTDKKLHSEKVEEPISSDIEVLNITSLRHEHTTLRNPKQTSTMCSLTSYSPVPPSCVQLQTGYRPQCTAWLCERPEPQQMICVSNYSYLNPITEPNEVEFTKNEPSLETSDSIQGPYAVYCYTCDSQF
uniref:Leukemia inhibitory factor receptor-like n=1 Tax=Cyprinodon variegatus TaxID=28743 RepID=A0A3Q2G2T9_CYPVA